MMDAMSSTMECREVIRSQELKRAFHASWIYEGKVYLHGGILKSNSNDIPFDDVVEIDVDACSAQNFTCKNQGPKRSHHKCVIVDKNCVCLVGGWDGRQRTSDVWGLNMESLEWVLLHPEASSDAPAGLSSHTCTRITSNEVIVSGREGGIRMQRRYGSVFKLTIDMKAQRYRYKELPMHISSRSGHIACFVNKEDGAKANSKLSLLIHGGRDSDSIELLGNFAKSSKDFPVNAAELETKIKSLLSPQVASAESSKVCTSLLSVKSRSLRHHSAVESGKYCLIHGGEVFGKARDTISEQRKDGTILYSCGGTNSEYEELRLLEVTSQQDTLIYVNRSGSEIVNASLSPNREVIAFTTLHHQNLSDVTSKESKSQVQDDAPDSDDSDDGVSEDDYDGSNHAENWQYSSNGNNDNDAKVEQETLHTQKSAIQMIKGKYSSYIADTYPTKWTKKFDISQSLYQKVIFTDCNITKTENGVRIRENRLLFVMHRKYIGLYSILLKPNVDKEPEKISAHTSVKKWIMYCAPRSVVIARRPLWSQWDGVNQRLYFVTVSRDKSIKTKPQVTYSTTFSCEQFIQSDAWTRRMFSFKVDFCLNRDVIARKTSEYFLAEMDPTVSSREINMKILNLMSGGICLVWQTLFYSNSGDRSLYKIALLDKDMVLSCLCDEKLDYYEKDPLQERFSFSSHGNNILIHVHGHNSFMHYLTVDCVTRKNDRLHHCHFLSETASFRTLKNIQQFPFLVDVDGNKVKSLYTIFVWDAISKSVFKLQLNREKMEQLCFDLEVPIENRLAAMRFGSLAFEDFSVREDNLREFLSIGMILNGDKFLGTLLIQFATTEVCMKFPDVQFLRNLLPLSVQLSTEDTRSFALSVKCCEIKENIQSQISSQAEEDVSISLSWKSTLLAFKCGHFVPCDLQAFSNEMEFLESPKLLKSQKDLMQNELNDIYEKEVSKPASHDGEKGKYNCDYSCEQNHSLENLMTLTYMKLTDHLKEALGNDKLAKHIARNFVMEQQRAADHFVTLFIFSTIVDDDDKSLLTPVNNQERQLLHLLRRMLCTCLNIYFPPPIGLQTRLTCLTFRYCVTAHITEGNFDYDFAETSESNGMNESSSSQGKFPACFKSEDINALSFEFFQLVDTKCIHVTGEFVAKLLEDLPDHEAFGGFIQQVLRRAHFQSENVSDSAMELWNHPYAWASLARNAMKRLSHLTGFDVIQTSAKSSGKRDVSPSTEPSHFEPLDVFLNDVQRCGEDADVCVTTVANATFQGVIRKHGKENLRHIAC